MPGSKDFARSWRGTAVDAFVVEHALADLTRQARPTTDQETFHPIPRTRVMTLVVRADPTVELATVVTEISHIADSHPLRALIVLTGRGAPAVGLDASAAIECVPRTGTPSSVCLERIQLSLSEAVSAHLSSVVAPLLIPDLPVVLWWLGNLPQPDDSMLDLGGNLLVDSDAHNARELPLLARLVKAISGRVNVRDLAWSALGPARDILTGLFDPTEARPYQLGVTSLRVAYEASALTQPLLLVGWLASRLNWTFTRSAPSPDGSSQRFQFRCASGPVEASLTAVPSHVASTECKVTGIELTARHAGHLATFSVSRQSDGGFWAERSALPGLPAISHPVAYTHPPLVVVLSGLLAFPKEDEGYHEALTVAARLVAS